MKVLVTGSRDWLDRDAVRQALTGQGYTVLVHGAARGLDTIAKQIAEELGIEARGYPGDWKRYGKSAGRRRNQQMLEEEHRPDEPIAICHAFPGPYSIGTWDMVRRAKYAGIPVEIHS